ncbi:MAG: glycosyltransferase [Phycisphaeraceae bacterium]
MHVALLANSAWLDEELPIFRHLVVGLLDEQVRVTQVVPQLPPGAEPGLVGEPLLWEESRWSWLNRYRLASLAPRLEELRVDLVHVLDGSLWAGGHALAKKLEVPAVYAVGSHLDLRFVQRVARDSHPNHAVFAAASQPLAEAIRDLVGKRFLIRTIPPGVHVQPRSPGCREDRAMCIAVSGNGKLDRRYEALLAALSDLLRDRPQLQFFLDGQGSEQHGIWRTAERLGLLPNLSLIPRRLGHRELLLRADALVHPQPLGRMRGLTLQAMASAMPVLAHADSWLDHLIEGETAWLTDHATSDAWTDLLTRLTEQPDEATALGQRAQAWIRQHRRPSTQVAGVLDTYRRLTGESFEFPTV